MSTEMRAAYQRIDELKSTLSDVRDVLDAFANGDPRLDSVALAIDDALDERVLA